MMRKVIDDGDAFDDGADLKPALDALERRQRLDDRLHRNALPCGKSGSSSRIQRIVLAGHRQAQLCKRRTATQRASSGLSASRGADR